MAFNINEIRAQLQGGGARPSLFQVRIQNPVNPTADVKLPFLCQAASIPGSILGVVEVPYFGRKIKLAGDRIFQEWAVTIINDEDFLIRNAMEEWSGAINKHRANVRTAGAPIDYKSTGQVIQYSKAGVPIREYTVDGIWPQDITPIELDWNATDTLELFQVTFQMDLWEVSGGVTGNAGGAS